MTAPAVVAVDKNVVGIEWGLPCECGSPDGVGAAVVTLTAQSDPTWLAARFRIAWCTGCRDVGFVPVRGGE